ncbi:MAG: arylsulfatase [Phycisphaerae bacterium]|nr:arylsulfatase [Phycisphaerae bacterium]
MALRAVCLWILAALLCGPAPAAPPNFILILADDLGYGEPGCYGQRIIRTPRLDLMAAEGARFTRAYAAAPVCAPSRCQLLTGRHAGHAFIRDNREVKPEGQLPLPESTVTIARRLRSAGYATGCAGKWGLGPPGSSGDPLNQGFEFFFGYNCQRQAHNFYPTHLWRNSEKVMLDGNTPGNLTGPHYAHALIMDEALAFIRRSADQPFFLFLAVTIPHVALQVPEEDLDAYPGIDDAPYDGKHGYLPHPRPHAAYAAMVSRLDRDVGRLLDLLADLGIDQRTLVIFTSDNGPTHGRVGGADSEFFRSTAGLRGLKGSVYEGGIRVPFIARWPGMISRGVVRDEPCIGYDLPATFLDLAGLPPMNDTDGVSLAPLLTGRGEATPREFFYWEFPGYEGQQAVLDGNLKAVRTGMHKGPIRTELYDLSIDPDESTDLSGLRPEDLARLEGIMRSQHTDSKEFPFRALDAPRSTAPE